MLEVKNLSVSYAGIKAVAGVSFGLGRGEILGLVGEFGSGKSTVALAIMRLIAAGKIETGEVIFQGNNLINLSEAEMTKIRGAKISMIFQDPFTSLDPVFSVGDQIAEAVQLHQGLSRRGSWQRAVEMLDLVRIKEPKLRIKNYSHQFSGGMRQRVMIAMALACQPALLIADEPTTALDVTVQAEILKLLQDLKRRLNLSILYITHNFGIIKDVCNRVVVLNKGVIVETGESKNVMANPREEYTKKLIESLSYLRQDVN